MELKSESERGIFVRCRTLFCAGIFVAVAFIVVALLVHFLINCNCGQLTTNTTDEGITSTPVPTHPPITNLRLPRNVRPLHYQLHVQPFLDNFTFIGNVVIDIECLEDTDTITLHSKDLQLNNESIQLRTNDNGNIEITSYEIDLDRSFLVFNLKEHLKASDFYELSLQFKGELSNDFSGFYRCKYDDDRWMAVTNFEPIDARRAFPCFDEPDMKATFTISIVRPKGFISVSNMQRKSEFTELNGALPVDWELDEYFTTPKMSTYLVAFVVANFTSVNRFSDSGVEFRVFSRHAAKGQTKFAVETGPKILDFFIDFFQFPFPLKKEDMIALPDFPFMAMENWGLITFLETYLLYDSKVSSIYDKAVIATTIAHELAHQWFGNLVTLVWWDETWLNEGFARYMEVVPVDHLFPDWHYQNILITELHTILVTDSLKTSPAISVYTDDSSEIKNEFESLSYQKGAAIIRMMINFLGNSVFREGIKTYFEEKKYDNAVQDDLWRHMTQAAKRNKSSVDVKTIMDTWTLQSGYPVVSVVRDTYSHLAILSQKTFRLIPDDTNNNNKWEIPLSFTTQISPNFDNTLPRKWMHNSSDEKSVTFTWNDGVPAGDKWIIFNLQQTGYYRVNYQNDNWALLTKQLMKDHDVIHVFNRAQLVDDAFNLARADELDYEVALSLSRYLEWETEFLPWKTAESNFGYIDSMLSRTDIYGLWRSFKSKLVKPHYDEIGFTHFSNEDENYINLDKQSLFVREACALDLEDCVEKSVSIYNNWITNISSIAPNLRVSVLCIAIRRGNINEWNSVWDRYMSSNVENEKVSFLKALTCTQEPWILKKMLNFILDPGDSLRIHYIKSIASGVSSNRVGRYMLFNFVRTKIEELYALLPIRIFKSVVKHSISNLNTPFELSQLKEFVSTNSATLSSIDRVVAQIIEKTEANVSWMERNLETIKRWLEKEEKLAELISE